MKPDDTTSFGGNIRKNEKRKLIMLATTSSSIHVNTWLNEFESGGREILNYSSFVFGIILIFNILLNKNYFKNIYF